MAIIVKRNRNKVIEAYWKERNERQKLCDPTKNILNKPGAKKKKIKMPDIEK